MNKSEPDFDKFTLDELCYVLSHIDHEKYPERVERLKEALANLKNKPRKSGGIGTGVEVARAESFCLSGFKLFFNRRDTL